MRQSDKLAGIAGIKGQVQRRGAERRRQIVDAAIGLFGQHGYRGTSVAAIGAAAGVTPSAVIHHFGTKEALLQAVLAEHDARSAARLEGYAGTGWAGLAEALLSDAEHTMRHSGLATLHAVLQAEQLGTGSPVHLWFQERGRMLRHHLAAVLADAGSDDPQGTAAELLAFLEGALILWLVDPETTDLRALYASYLARLTASLP
ncbi:TetR/AcrR family transcriptional regulator [Longispora albida]|uniref:TetR/AcrR family transcriptional regulator n=1 Tax=Longispora albida TaxID=203523 RepID=UPI00036C9044|nr:TetR/AcrR family transcriptional regulator [Longispora albida]